MQQQNNIVYSILANMDKVSVEDIDRILPIIVYTKFSQFEGVFNYCKDYNSQIGRMPDEEYLNIQFNQMLNTEYPPFHKNYIREFIDMLERESISTRTHSLTIQGKFQDAANLINKYTNQSSVKDLATVQTIIQKYRVLKKQFSHGLKTGIEELDDLINFYTYKTLNVIVAPSSNFKTTLGCSICYNALFKQGLNVVYFTLEDNTEFLYYNFLSRHSYEIGKPISGNELKKYLLPDDRESLLDEVGKNWVETIKGKLEIVSSEEIGTFTPSNIVNMLTKIQDKNGPIDVVVVDHFNIMNDPIPGIRLSGPELFSYYVRFMTNLSITFGEKGFVLLGLSQSNREGTSAFNKGKDMDTTQIANTSELERSATTVLSLFADDQLRAQNKVKLKMLKNRLGERNKIMMPNVKPEYFKIGNSMPEALGDEESLRRSIMQVAPASTLVPSGITQ